MRTEWDYTDLAEAYIKRPDYSDEAIDNMLSMANIHDGDTVCDVGAGVAHLTIKLAERNLKVIAVEPNDAMRESGIRRTACFSSVGWHEGTGERTGQKDDMFNLVSFGSSFNVTDRKLALLEAGRILKLGGWFACMWNHRDLDDPLQSEIENIIKTFLPEYSYGTRRKDQTSVISQSGLFDEVQRLEGKVYHEQTFEDCIEAWRSHATLHRQAGDNFDRIIKEIETLLISTNMNAITVPYTTRIWMAQVNK